MIEVRDLSAGFHYLHAFFEKAAQLALMGNVLTIRRIDRGA